MSMKNRCNASLDQICLGSMTFNIWSGMIAFILQSIFGMIQSNNSSLTMFKRTNILNTYSDCVCVDIFHCILLTSTYCFFRRRWL